MSTTGSALSDAASRLAERITPSLSRASDERTSVASQTGSQSQPEQHTHVVQPNEQLTDLVQQHRVPVHVIVHANAELIRDPERPLTEGDRLTIPVNPEHQLEPQSIASPQTLQEFAEQRGLDAQQLARDNGLPPDARLTRDDVLLAPATWQAGPTVLQNLHAASTRHP